ncbi:MAG: SDR family NAD(P)-dependent oxidoreductase, partial [Chloroflexales bacterium]
VISGRTAGVRDIAAQCVAKGIRTQSLTVSHAFHSPLMEPMLADFRAVAETISYHAPTQRLVSNLTGGLAGNEITTPDYWVRHVRAAVRFGDGIRTLHAQGVEIFLEIGPKPVLLGMVGELPTSALPPPQPSPDGGGSPTPPPIGGRLGGGPIASHPPSLIPSLRPGQGNWQTLLQSLATLYVRGVAIDWQSFDRDSVRQKVALPTYPFQRQHYWVAPVSNTGAASLLPADIPTDELVARLASVGSLSAAERLLLPRLLDLLRNLPEQDKSNVVFDYYNALSHASVAPDQDEDGEETFLTFGPLPQIVPGFSWLLTLADPARYREHAALSRAAQIDMRRMLFRKVDFTGCRTVLDFGCGYGSDLLQLATRYPHLSLDGYTISSGQAEIGNRRAAQRAAQERLHIYHRDSARDAFPASYDLAFGFEVVHHIKDKAALFANLAEHLREDGLLVLADFISNTEFAIEHAETSSYFITRAEWVDLLTRNHLHLIAAINISQEAANYLHDPAFAENLAQREQGMDPHITSALQSYNQLGKLLRKELASYVLLTAQKRSDLAHEDLEQRNLAALEQMSSYVECSPQQWLYAPTWRPVPDRQRALRDADSECAAGTWLLLAPPPQPSPAGGGSHGTPPPSGGRLGGGNDTFQTTSNTTVVNIFAERIPPITPPSPPASGGEPMHCSPPLAGGLGGGDSNDNCSTNAPDECGRMLLAGLRRYGAQPVLGTPGDTLAQVAPDHWTVRPDAGEDLVALLRAIGQPIRAVVDLWSTGMPMLATTDADHVATDTLANTTAALHLARALASTATPPRLWFVTRGAVAVRDDDDVQAQQSPVWGLANVVAREHPELHCGRVDLDGTHATVDVDSLLAELLLPDAESQVAYRGGVRHVARLVRRPLVDEIAPLVIDSEASYLITGGLGALGLQIAHGLIQAGARHLVLTGRSGAQGKEADVRRLEQAGALVHVYALDVADPAAVTALVETIRTTLPPLRGIIHAAGVLDDATLVHQSSARLQRVMAPKVAGTWNLHCATAGLSLDFFVCFSSLAALVGSPGQSNYAAANAFMDAIAHVRRRSGLPAQSINWGPWAGPGMADTDRARRSHTGVDAISAEQGIALFRALLAQPVTQVGVALIRWSELDTQDDPFFAECIPAAGAVAPAHVQSKLQQQLSTAVPADYLPILIATLQVEVSRVLGRSELPAVHQGFMDMGMDSLMSIELRNQLQRDLGIPLSATLMFKYPNVGDLATYLAQELQPQSPPAASDSGLEIAADTPDADMDASIAEELARLTDLLGS